MSGRRVPVITDETHRTDRIEMVSDGGATYKVVRRTVAPTTGSVLEEGTLEGGLSLADAKRRVKEIRNAWMGSSSW